MSFIYKFYFRFLLMFFLRIYKINPINLYDNLVKYRIIPRPVTILMNCSFQLNIHHRYWKGKHFQYLCNIAYICVVKF